MKQLYGKAENDRLNDHFQQVGKSFSISLLNRNEMLKTRGGIGDDDSDEDIPPS